MSTYTEAMEQTIVDAAPLDLAKAKVLASEMGVTYRSVVSKASQLGVEYIKVSKAKKTAAGAKPTKAQLLQEIRESLDLPEREGDISRAELETIHAALIGRTDEE